jgi:hypothetical protein
MSRYLEMSVEGTLEGVGERIQRAFRKVGKVQTFDASKGQIAGVIRVSGEPADVRVSWYPGRENRIRIDIAATSDDTLSQAADSALYTFASSYKAVGWPNPERDRRERWAQLLRRGGMALAAVLALSLAYLLLATAGYLPTL